MDTEKERIQLQSGCNVDLSWDVCNNYFHNFDEAKYFIFSNIINSGLYFPQIMQFIFVMVCICKGNTSFKDIFFCNLLNGIWFTVAWFWLKLHKIPGINFICCFIGGNIFRFFLHFIAIAVVAFFVVNDWKVILYCLIGGIVTAIIKSILFVKLSTVKYNDGVAIYVSKFKT